VDGDISSQIRIFSEGLTATTPGIYPVTLEVTNSLGNTARVTLDVIIEETSSVDKPRVYLNNYLVYLSAEDAFSADKYLDSVIGGRTSNVDVAMPENGLVPGVNVVTYTGLGANGEVGTTLLYVIVE
jgi:PKD repeat protein